MRNLITGGAGFIGSHLAEHLLSLGEEVIVWDDLSTGQMSNLRGCVGQSGFRYIIGDFTKDTKFVGVVESVDVVYHLAAAVGVQLIVNNPVRTIETNIKGAEVALNASARFGKRIFIASTSEVYGKGTKIPFSEGRRCPAWIGATALVNACAAMSIASPRMTHVCQTLSINAHPGPLTT